MNDAGKKCPDQPCPQSSNRGAWDLGKKPNLTALFITDCNRCLSEGSRNPHQRGDAYSILLISVAWVTSHRALPLSPFDLKTLRAKNVWVHRLIHYITLHYITLLIHLSMSSRYKLDFNGYYFKLIVSWRMKPGLIGCWIYHHSLWISREGLYFGTRNLDFPFRVTYDISEVAPLCCWAKETWKY